MIGKIQDFILACTYTDYFWRYTQETDKKKLLFPIVKK